MDFFVFIGVEKEASSEWTYPAITLGVLTVKYDLYISEALWKIKIAPNSHG